jgi:hypothetical protein
MRGQKDVQELGYRLRKVDAGWLRRAQPNGSPLSERTVRESTARAGDNGIVSATDMAAQLA